MYTGKIIKWFVACVVVVFTTSCATPVYRQYNGAQRQSENIAVLRGPTFTDPGVFVEKVDGNPPPDAKWNRNFYGSKFDGSFRIHLLPGKHTILVRATDIKWKAVGSLEVRFSVQAGKEYMVRASANLATKTWRAWVEELERK